MFIFSRIIKNPNHLHAQEGLVLARRAAREGNFRRAKQKILSQMRVIEHKLKQLPRTEKIIKKGYLHRLKECSRELLLVSYLSDRRSYLGDLHTALKKLLRKDKILAICRRMLNRKDAKRIIYEAELNILAQSDCWVDLEQQLQVATAYFSPSQCLNWRIKILEHKLAESLKDSADRSKASDYCLELASLHSSNHARAYRYRKLAIIYQNGNLNSRLERVKDFLRAEAVTNQFQEATFLKAEICSFAFEGDSYDFAVKYRRWSQLLADFYAQNYYSRRDYQILLEWIQLGALISKFKRSSSGAFYKKLKSRKFSPRVLTRQIGGNVTDEVRQAYQGLRAVIQFLKSLDGKDKEPIRKRLTSSKDLNDVLGLVDKGLLTLDGALQCLCNFVLKQNLSLAAVRYETRQSPNQQTA